MVRTPSPDTSGLKKGTWTPQEDKKLIAYVTRYGSWNWRQIPRFAGLARCGKSCRLRWLNYLRPNIKRGNYTAEEEEVIIRLHEKLGNKWSVIATHLPGRTDNEIKNHWHANLKKRFGKNSDGHNENVKATKSNTSGSTQDKKDSIENFHGNSSSTTSKACDSGRLSSDFTTVVTDENLSLEDEFDFVDACLEEVNENIWTELYVGNIFNTPMSDNGNGNGNFDGSDATRTMDAWRLSDSNEYLVAENDDFPFLEAMTANFWIEASAADMSLVPKE